jgi:hypothetical protein
VLAIRSMAVGLVTMRKRSDYVVNFLVADDSEVDGDKSVSQYLFFRHRPKLSSISALACSRQSRT